MTGLLCIFKEKQKSLQSFYICAGSTVEFVIIPIMLQRKTSDTLGRFPPTPQLVKESNETILDVFKEKKKPQQTKKPTSNNTARLMHICI